MDDNHRLIEWLAYHHFALPLRRLIVMVDPRSKTSPLPILQRWEKYMTIDLWHDNDVFSKQELDDRSHENSIALFLKAISLPSIVKNILIPNAKYNWNIVIHYGTLPSANEDDISNTDTIHNLGEISKVIAANVGKSPPSVIIKDDEKVESEFEYGRVAFFRLDAFYAVPVDIFKVDKDTFDYGNRYAVIPAFGKYPVNDQMIYSPTEAVKIWAMTRRNDIIDTSEPGSIGLASAQLMADVIVPTIMDKAACNVVKNPDVCFYRTRASDVVLINDCSDEQGASVRGVQDIDQVELVENIVQRKCTKACIDAGDEEEELHCDKSSWAVSSRFLQTSSPAPAPAPPSNVDTTLLSTITGPPTAAPTSTPTTTPTIAPTSAPTPAPTAPEDICTDSTTGTFTLDNVGKDVTCARLARNSQQTSDTITKYFGRNSVKFLCPLSCNACETLCVDDSSFTF
ncbi:hypothetical protein CTEN210_05085 [Chaetoceros tenuissimus]|uniref:Uncharacterized protein n=1 Tax=Chaetoceros tenuissimus TaxID=426638 RepID=A0AAD3CMS5_9STRA|nr:hypothetical protein CTEN210_05085 [Chaetoceros tenuissimus]